MARSGLLHGKILWTRLVAEQQRWIRDCGGDLAGYLDKYCRVHGRTEENARAIYNADVAELQRREERLKGYNA